MLRVIVSRRGGLPSSDRRKLGGPSGGAKRARKGENFGRQAYRDRGAATVPASNITILQGQASADLADSARFQRFATYLQLHSATGRR